MKGNREAMWPEGRKWLEHSGIVTEEAEEVSRDLHLEGL